MNKMDLLEGMSNIDDAFLNEAETGGIKFSRRSAVKRWAAPAAAVLALSLIIPNTNADAANRLSNLPVVGAYFKAVTFRSYSYSDSRHDADITMPKIISGSKDESGDTLAEVNTDIEKTVAKLTEEFKQSLKTDGVKTTKVDYSVITDDENWYCIRLSMFEAEASGYEHAKYYTIDKKTGNLATLEQVFGSPDYITAISNQIKKQMRSQMAADENVSYMLDSEFPEDDFHTIDDDTQFYINPSGELVIYFAEGDVAPMYMGEVEFVIER